MTRFLPVPTQDDPHAPATPIRALILDDDSFDRSRIRRLGADSGLAIEFSEAQDFDSFRQALDERPFDVVLVDYHLPSGNGLEAIENVLAHSRNAHCPTIMVAGRDQANLAVAAMRSGCLDYLAKDGLSSEGLRDSITGAMERARQLALAEAARDAIEANYRRALQGGLARVVRSVRDLKSAMRRPGSNIPAGLQTVEKDCLEMWSIVAPKRKSGD